MVKRLFLLSLLVLALCGASAVATFAGGAPGGAGYMPPPPMIPPICGPVTTNYSQIKEEVVPVPAQLRKVRVVAPYLAGVAWPRTPLPFFGNPLTTRTQSRWVGMSGWCPWWRSKTRISTECLIRAARKSRFRAACM